MLNWASICRNHTVGSVGQNGGSLMLTAARVGGGGGATEASVGCVTSTPPLLWMAASSVVAMVEIAERALAEELTELAERPRITSWSPM